MARVTSADAVRSISPEERRKAADLRSTVEGYTVERYTVERETRPVEA
jgi:hypothetical protein